MYIKPLVGEKIGLVHFQVVQNCISEGEPGSLLQDLFGHSGKPLYHEGKGHGGYYMIIFRNIPVFQKDRGDLPFFGKDLLHTGSCEYFPSP